MKRINIAYIILIISLFLMISNIINIDFNDLSNNRYSGIASNILLIASMIFTIRDLKRKNLK